MPNRQYLVSAGVLVNVHSLQAVICGCCTLLSEVADCYLWMLYSSEGSSRLLSVDAVLF